MYDGITLSFDDKSSTDKSRTLSVVPTSRVLAINIYKYMNCIYSFLYLFSINSFIVHYGLAKTVYHTRCDLFLVESTFRPILYCRFYI